MKVVVLGLKHLLSGLERLGSSHVDSEEDRGVFDDG